MAKGQSLQEPFLNTLRRERVPVSIYLVNGIKLQGQIESTLARLHGEGARAVESVCDERGWILAMTPEVEARAFWSTLIGVALQEAATSTHPDPTTAEAVISLFFTLHPKESS